MQIPKKYHHDKYILALLGANGALFIVAITNVLLNVDTSLNAVSIISYRSSRAIQVSGPTSELYQFAILACISTVVMTIISIKLFVHRRHLAISVLGLNIISLVLCLVVFNALTRTL